ncbi:unnamed protein product [Diabrotica balteata]|uniref:ATP-dependent DNA helicase n=1 Tax=Diabrotica balteata TaxID=107213 RepID=A0A9N9SW43_DIABA|nr:unnamed protein product [Diabrotica balteata]
MPHYTVTRQEKLREIETPPELLNGLLIGTDPNYNVFLKSIRTFNSAFKWVECTMAQKHSIEALNRTLKDIKNNDKLFGGTLLVLSGDFRQTLSVIPRSTYADEINACLKSSPLWHTVEKVQLKVNMHVQMLQDHTLEFI